VDDKIGSKGCFINARRNAPSTARNQQKQGADRRLKITIGSGAPGNDNAEELLTHDLGLKGAETVE